MLDPSSLTLFDNSFYLEQNPDVATAVARGAFSSGLDHFIQYGQFEGRDPNYLFDTSFYLQQNLDVAAAVARNELTGIEHFIQFGQFEGRDPSAPEVFFERANQTIALEIAQTPEQQAQGLMYRPTLASDRGMLFPFNPPQIVSFYMKDVLIPLDIIFLRNGNVLEIAANVPPCTTEPCPLYFPTVESAQGVEQEPVDQVIELPGGRAAELGLQVGDNLSIQPLTRS